MELFFISLIVFMLLMIAVGAVAWCYAAYRKASRAIKRTEALYEGQEYLARKLGELEDKAREKPAQEPTETDKRAARVDAQMDAMMGWMPDNVGLKLGGDLSES